MGRRLNQREFRPMAEVPFRPVRQLSEYKGKGASASRESNQLFPYLYYTVFPLLFHYYYFFGIFNTSRSPVLLFPVRYIKTM